MIEINSVNYNPTSVTYLYTLDESNKYYVVMGMFGGLEVKKEFSDSTERDELFDDIKKQVEALGTVQVFKFQGTLGSVDDQADYTSLPTSNYLEGYAYRVVTAGTYAGRSCEVGDLIVAIHDGPTSGSTVINDDWSVVQSNIDGAVTTDDESLGDGFVVIGAGGKSVKGTEIIADELPTNLTNGEGDYSLQQKTDAENQPLALGKWSMAEGRGQNFIGDIVDIPATALDLFTLSVVSAEGVLHYELYEAD